MTESTAFTKEKTDPHRADRVTITYYTDPLCCWSWALDQHLQRLRNEYYDKIQWSYVMGGMISNWKNYHDPVNAVNKPLQFGPIWMYASQVTGTKMDYSVWHKDPPTSSYPSCIAVKCAEMQSNETGELLLKKLREAIMTRGENISKESVILSIARALSNEEISQLDYERFLTAWRDGSGIEAFRGDLQLVRYHRIGRFPTLTLTDPTGSGIVLTGYRPYQVLKDALTHMFGMVREQK